MSDEIYTGHFLMGNILDFQVDPQLNLYTIDCITKVRTIDNRQLQIETNFYIFGSLIVEII